MSIENDIERYENFEFIAPPVMVDNDLELKLVETLPFRPEGGYVPEYKFAMVNVKSQATMGSIDLRVGLTEKLRVLGGHIGYDVDEPYRGHRYAARSCRLLLPFARSVGINPVMITCAPDNIASVKTIESLGAVLVATNEVEIEPGRFRRTSVYHQSL
jgi:predicted acetyltransferase